MHTRDEAKKLICPMQADGFCEADRCAAWRWGSYPKRNVREDPHKSQNVHNTPPQPGNIPDSWGVEWWDDEGAWFWVEPTEEADSRRRGYCGLVGKPEFDE